MESSYDCKLDNGNTFDFRLHDVSSFPSYMQGMDILSIMGASPEGADVTMFLPTMNALLGIEEEDDEEDDE